MAKNSVISIVNHQNVFSQNDKIEYIVAGKYIEKNGKYYIIYKEHKDGIFSSYGDDVCCIKVESSNLVTITRQGLYKSKLILEREKRHCNQYRTQYGTINMGIYTYSIEHNLRETEGELYLKYFIDIDFNLMCKNEVYIKVKENS